MAYCLPKHLANDFLKKIKSGEISPDKLTKMTSQERNATFAELLGKENSQKVNALFESKLLLKNQQQGIISWVKTVGGMKAEVKRDILSKVEKMTEVLQPAEKTAFLNDLVTQKLGMSVSLEEANTIAKLAKDISDKRTIRDAGGDRLEYGRAKVAFGNYVSDLKNASKRLTPLEMLASPVRLVTEVAGTSKAIKASMDNSAIFRQGWKTLWTHPLIWQKNARRSFVDIWQTFGKTSVMNELKADIYSRPNYNLMVKAKLAVGTVEEEFPSTLPRKIPLVGKVYKASENAFTAFVYRQRADIFDKYVDVARKNGIDLTDKLQIESIGKLVNSLVGRGNIGRLEPVADILNNVFFSPRLLKSHIDVLTLHSADKMSGFARKQAAINLLKIISGTAAVLATAEAIRPGSVEKDPRSADFGKIRVGDTRFDVSGGMASIVVLASRLISQSTKSSTTGRVREINTGKYGASTGKDVIYNFFENKLSPAARAARDILEGKDFDGKKPTALSTLNTLYTPIIIENYDELKNNPKAADVLGAMIADGLGIGTNTYSRQKKQLKKDTSWKLMDLLKKNTK